jgi:hypothetical protein
MMLENNAFKSLTNSPEQSKGIAAEKFDMAAATGWMSALTIGKSRTGKIVRPGAQVYKPHDPRQRIRFVSLSRGYIAQMRH